MMSTVRNKKRDADKTPLRLSPSNRGKRQKKYTRKCDISNNTTNNELLRGYQIPEKARYEETHKLAGSINSVAAKPTLPNSLLFKALFA